MKNGQKTEFDYGLGNNIFGHFAKCIADQRLRDKFKGKMNSFSTFNTLGIMLLKGSSQMNLLLIALYALNVVKMDYLYQIKAANL